MAIKTFLDIANFYTLGCAEHSQALRTCLVRSAINAAMMILSTITGTSSDSSKRGRRLRHCQHPGYNKSVCVNGMAVNPNTVTLMGVQNKLRVDVWVRVVRLNALHGRTSHCVLLKL